MLTVTWCHLLTVLNHQVYLITEAISFYSEGNKLIKLHWLVK